MSRRFDGGLLELLDRVVTLRTIPGTANGMGMISWTGSFVRPDGDLHAAITHRQPPRPNYPRNSNGNTRSRQLPKKPQRATSITNPAR